MKLLRLGKGLTFPMHAITETFAVLGVRGSGKSNAAAVMAEEMFKAELPFVVIDPVGSWWGLRSSGDGKRPGLEIPIFGGPKGDVPLERRGGNLIADLIVDERLSCVLDLRTLDSEGGKKDFLLDFARRLYTRNEAPLHLFLEEADDYIPQQPWRQEKELKRAFENIVRRGRNRGLGITMITQRSASIAKDVLTQAGTLIAFRTTGPRDRAAVLEWVKYHDQDLEIAKSLPELADGQCWIWSPEFLGDTVQNKFRRRETFDSGQTPKMLKAMKRPARLADVDLAAVEKKMAATIERAKAEDPKALRAENVKLRKELEIAQNNRSVVTKVAFKKAKIIKQPALTKREWNVLNKVVQTCKKELDQLESIATQLSRVLVATEPSKGEAEFPINLQHNRKEQLPSTYTTKGRLELRSSVNPEKPRVKKYDLNGRLNPGERAILTVIVQYEKEGADQEQIAVLTGYKQTSRVTYLKQLRQKGFIFIEGNKIYPTNEGTVALGPVEELPTGEALQQFWLNRLSPGEKKIFDALLQAYPKSLGNPEIQYRTEYKATSVVTYLKQLRARKLVTTERGTAQASSKLFD